VNASVGYRHYSEGTDRDAGVAGFGFDLVLPVGHRLTVGLQPVALRYVFGGDRSEPEIVSRLLRFNYKLSDRLFLSVDATIEVNWLKPKVEWTLGAGLNWSPVSRRLSRGLDLGEKTERNERRDAAWVPPAAPYGRLLGRAPSWYVFGGDTTAETPANAVEGRR